MRNFETKIESNYLRSSRSVGIIWGLAGSILVFFAISSGGPVLALDGGIFRLVETRRYELHKEIMEENQKVDSRHNIDLVEITTEWKPHSAESADSKFYSVNCTRIVYSGERGKEKTFWDSDKRTPAPRELEPFQAVVGDMQIVEVDSIGGLSIAQLGPVFLEAAQYRSKVNQSRRNFAAQPKLTPDDIAVFDKEAAEEYKKLVTWMILPPSLDLGSGSEKFKIRNCDFPQEFRTGYSLGFRVSEPQPKEEVRFVVELTPESDSDPFYRRTIEKGHGKVAFALSSEKHFPRSGSFVANFDCIDATQGTLLQSKVKLVADVNWSIKRE